MHEATAHTPASQRAVALARRQGLPQAPQFAGSSPIVASQPSPAIPLQSARPVSQLTIVQVSAMQRDVAPAPEHEPHPASEPPESAPSSATSAPVSATSSTLLSASGPASTAPAEPADPAVVPPVAPVPLAPPPPDPADPALPELPPLPAVPPPSLPVPALPDLPPGGASSSEEQPCTDTDRSKPTTRPVPS